MADVVFRRKLINSDDVLYQGDIVRAKMFCDDEEYALIVTADGWNEYEGMYVKYGLVDINGGQPLEAERGSTYSFPVGTTIKRLNEILEEFELEIIQVYRSDSITVIIEEEL